MIASTLALTSSLVCNAQERPNAEQLFQARFGFAPPPAAGNDAQMRLLRQVLQVELYYFQKICRPDDDQLRAVTQDCEVAVRQIANVYRDLSQRRGTTTPWPDPHEAIIKRIEAVVERVMPPESGQRYRDQQVKRRDVWRDANVAAMVNRIDETVELTPGQFRQIAEMLISKWDSRWSPTEVVLIEQTNCIYPGVDTIGPLLSPTQSELWAIKSSRQIVRTTWQVRFAIDALIAKVAIPQFVDGPVARDEKDDSSADPLRSSDGAKDASSDPLPEPPR